MLLNVVELRRKVPEDKEKGLAQTTLETSVIPNPLNNTLPENTGAIPI